MNNKTYSMKTGGFSQQHTGKQRHQLQNSDFFLLANQMITRMQGECRPKTVFNCQTALRALQRYLDCCRPELKKRLPLRCLTPELATHFHRYLVGRGVGENAIRAYLRSLRSVVNRCIWLGLPLRGNLFSQVRTSTLSSTKQPPTGKIEERLSTCLDCGTS